MADDRERRGRQHGILSDGDDKFIRQIVADENSRWAVKVLVGFMLAFGVQIVALIWVARGVVADVDANTTSVKMLMSERVLSQDLQIRDERIQTLNSQAAHNRRLLLEISRSVAELSNNVAVLSAQMGRDKLVQ